jgi:hypothetical protein
MYEEAAERCRNDHLARKESVTEHSARACARGRGSEFPQFPVVFYGLKTFCCKTARFCATPRERLTTETPRICNPMQHRQKTRKNSFFN